MIFLEAGKERVEWHKPRSFLLISEPRLASGLVVAEPCPEATRASNIPRMLSSHLTALAAQHGWSSVGATALETLGAVGDKGSRVLSRDVNGDGEGERGSIAAGFWRKRLPGG